MPATPDPPPPFDPECAAALAALPAFPPVSVETIPLLRAGPQPTDDELSRGRKFDVLPKAVPGPPGGPEVNLLVCRPSRPERNLPVLYFIHGGGMILGTARDGLAEVLALAEPLGAAVVSVDHRLAPETPHPGPVEDCHAGLTWLLDSADELGIDASRVVLIGTSSGGGLAAALTLLARERGAAGVAGQLLMSPMLDDRNDSVSARQMAAAPLWDRSANDVGWTALLGNRRGGSEVPSAAAPAREQDLSGLPPAYLDVGSADLFRDETVAYAGGLWRAGGVAELHVWPGGYHGFDAIAPSARLSRAARGARANWLARLLGR